MNLNDELNEFYKEWNPRKGCGPELALAYLPLAKRLMFSEEELVKNITRLLTENIQIWARKNSTLYKDLEGITTKENFYENRFDWCVFDYADDSSIMRSSGTTGKPLDFLRWNKTFEAIEGDNHYDMILEEFDVPKNPSVLFFLMQNSRKHNNAVTILDKNENFMECHGFKNMAHSQVHFVENNEFYFEKREYFYELLLNHIDKHKIDVILTSGKYLNELARFIRLFDYKGRGCHLLSNTYAHLLNKDVRFLLGKGFAKHICDHMRVWDGGASFFTCKAATYHLMDNMSWCYADFDKLISTDYFSFPSPFINYWSGDFGIIENQYRRCECGRLFRPFLFLPTRKFGIKGNISGELKAKINAENVDGIKSVTISGNNLEIITDRNITEKNKNKLIEKFKDYKVFFAVDKNGLRKFRIHL